MKSLLKIAVLLLLTPLAWAQVEEQNGSIASSTVPTSGTTFNVTLTGVGAGNAIIAMIEDNATSTFTFSSDNDGAPTDSQGSQDADSAENIAMAYWLDVAGGSTEISATAAVSTTSSMYVYEFSGVDQLDVDFVVQDFTDLGTEDLAGAGTVAVGANSVCVKGWSASTTSVTVTPDTNYVTISDALRGHFYYKITASAIADEDATISASPTTRDGPTLFFCLSQASGSALPVIIQQVATPFNTALPFAD